MEQLPPRQKAAFGAGDMHHRRTVCLPMPDIQQPGNNTDRHSQGRSLSQPELNNHALRNEVRRLQAALVDRFRGNSRFISGGGFKGSATPINKQCEDCGRLQKALWRIKQESKELRASAEGQAKKLADSEQLRENFAAQLLKQRKVAFETQGRLPPAKHRTREQQKQVVELESTIQSLRDELAKVYRDRTNFQKEAATAKQSCDEASAQLQKAKDDLQESMAKSEASEQALLDSKKLRNQVEDLDFESKSAQRRVHDTQRKLVGAQLANEKVKQELESEKEARTAAEQRLEVLLAQIRQAEGAQAHRLGALQAELGQKDAQSEQATALAQQLQKRLDLAHRELSELQRERCQQQDRTRECEARLTEVQDAMAESLQKSSASKVALGSELEELRRACAHHEAAMRKSLAEAAAAARAQTQWEKAQRKQTDQQKRQEQQHREREREWAREREQEVAAANARADEAEAKASRTRLQLEQAREQTRQQVEKLKRQLLMLQKQLSDQQSMHHKQRAEQESGELQQEQQRRELLCLQSTQADLRGQLNAQATKLEDVKGEREAERAAAAAHAKEREREWARKIAEQREHMLQEHERRCAELSAELSEAARRAEERVRDARTGAKKEVELARKAAEEQGEGVAGLRETLAAMESRLNETQREAAKAVAAKDAAERARKQESVKAKKHASEYVARNLVQMCVVAPMVTVNWGDKAMRFKTSMPSAQIKRVLQSGVLPRFVSIFLQEEQPQEPQSTHEIERLREATKYLQPSDAQQCPLREGQSLHEWVAAQGTMMQQTLEKELRPVFESNTSSADAAGAQEHPNTTAAGGRASGSAVSPSRTALNQARAPRRRSGGKGKGKAWAE